MAKARKPAGVALLDEDADPGQPIYGCAAKALPESLWEVAMETARSMMPANVPDVSGLSKIFPEAVVEALHKPKKGKPSFIAAVTTKYWRTNQDKLGVAFMEETTTELQNKILAFANKWGARGANIKFVPASKAVAEIRLSRGGGGYYSYIGTDVLHIDKNEQTMNLEQFVLRTPDSEYDRVVCHEFGHTLGFPHEHMRPELVALLDVNATIAYFRRTQGWSPADVRAQVLTALDKRSIIGTPPDQTSIMCYQLPGEITKNHQPIPGGIGINDTDYKFVGDLWPGAVIPTPPVEPPPVGENKGGLITINLGTGDCSLPAWMKPKLQG